MLNELQKGVADAVRSRFGTSKYSPSQRSLAVLVQLGDLADILLIREGAKEDHKKQYLNYKEALAAVLVDLLVLSEQLGVDLDTEVQRAISWFRTGKMQ